MIKIILINWNGHEDTVACLESLARIKEQNFQVILVDNNSEPRSVQHILDWCDGHVDVATQHPAWKYVERDRAHNTSWKYAEDLKPGDRPFLSIIRNKKNLGFAAANNIGMSLALSSEDTRFVWLLNNDTVVASDCLNAMYCRMQGCADLGVLGATVLYYDSPTTVQALAGAYFDSMWVYGDHIGRDLTLPQIPQREVVEEQLTYILGASMFVSRRFMEVVGPMNETYFLFMEELDWSERNRGRFEFGWEPTALVFHKEGRSTGSSQRTRPSATSIYYQSINLLRFYKLYYPSRLPLSFLRLFARTVKYLAKMDVISAYFVSLAVLDFITRRRRTGPIFV